MQELHRLGNEQYRRAEFHSALKSYSKALQHEPKNEKLYSNRSAAYFALQKYSKALKDAKRCVSLKPNWSRGYLRKGNALAGMGKLQQAESAYEEALAAGNIVNENEINSALVKVKTMMSQQQRREHTDVDAIRPSLQESMSRGLETARATFQERLKTMSRAELRKMSQRSLAADGIVLKAHLARDRGDYATAKPLYEDAAQQGSADAMYNLSLFYKMGYGMTSPNVDMFLHWVNEAAKEPALHPLTGLANTGVAEAFNALGVFYRDITTGTGIEDNHNEMMRCFRRSAECGCFAAQNSLAAEICASGGDLAEARQWYEAAAKQQYPRAMTNLAEMMISGAGGPRDVNGAKQWLQRAKDAGYADAGLILAQLAFTGDEGVTNGVIDEDEAVEVAEASLKSAQHVDVITLIQVAHVHLERHQRHQYSSKLFVDPKLVENGNDAIWSSTSDDVKRAQELLYQAFDKALSMKNPDHILKSYMALLSLIGNKSDKDDDELFRVHQKAAKDGDCAEAMYHLSCCLDLGIGTTQPDATLSLKWLTRAVRKGCDKARDSFARTAPRLRKRIQSEKNDENNDEAEENRNYHANLEDFMAQSLRKNGDGEMGAILQGFNRIMRNCSKPMSPLSRHPNFSDTVYGRCVLDWSKLVEYAETHPDSRVVRKVMTATMLSTQMRSQPQLSEIDRLKLCCEAQLCDEKAVLMTDPSLIESAEALLKRQPNNVAAMVVVSFSKHPSVGASLYERCIRLIEAEDEAAVEYLPYLARMYSICGSIYGFLKQWQQALQKLEKARKLDVHNELCDDIYAMAYMRMQVTKPRGIAIS